MRCNSVGGPCFRTSRRARGFIGAGIGTGIAALLIPRGVCVQQRTPIEIVLSSIAIIALATFIAVDLPQCDNIERLPPEP